MGEWIEEERELSTRVWKIIIIQLILMWWLAHVSPMTQERNHFKITIPTQKGPDGFNFFKVLKAKGELLSNQFSTERKLVLSI